MQRVSINKFAYPLTWVAFLSLSGEVLAADRAVTVSGTCLRQVTPDRGSIVLTSEIRGNDAKRVSTEAGQLYEKVKERINRLKLDALDLQTTEFQVEEIREWEKDRMVSRGYRGRVGLKVSTNDHTRLGEVADAASREGVKDIGRLTMSLSPAKERTERNECLKEAAEQARLKAAKLAETLGARLGDVQTIQETSSVPVPPVMPFQVEAMADMRSAKAMSAPPALDAGRQELHVSVTASFALK